MGSLSIWHWLVVLLLVVLLFGRGKISDMMGDVAKGIKSFKQGMNEEETKPAAPHAQIAAQPASGRNRGPCFAASSSSRATIAGTPRARA